jgi:hypothetical protein
MVATLERKSRIRVRAIPKIPEALVYETLDGKPFYYKGYREVLSKKKTLEEIMGCSTLQAELVSYIMEIFFITIKPSSDLYRIYCNEIGNHIDHRNNLSNDIAIFEKSVMTPDKINTKYADVPAKVVVEIDIKADISDPEDSGYVYRKTQKLLDFGTEKVIWVFSLYGKVLIAEQGQDWITRSWDKDVELLNGYTFNIEKHLRQEGIIQ